MILCKIGKKKVRFTVDLKDLIASKVFSELSSKTTSYAMFAFLNKEDLDGFLKYVVEVRGYSTKIVDDSLMGFYLEDREYNVLGIHSISEPPFNGYVLAMSFSKNLSVDKTIKAARASNEFFIKELGSWARGYNDSRKLERMKEIENILITKDVSDREKKKLLSELDIKQKDYLLTCEFGFDVLERFVYQYGMPVMTLPYRITVVKFKESILRLDMPALLISGVGLETKAMDKVLSGLVVVYNKLLKDKGLGSELEAKLYDKQQFKLNVDRRSYILIKSES